MKRIIIDDLPAQPLAASGVFHQHWLPHAEKALASGDDVTLVFAPADHTHSAWRRAAVQGLARQHAPRRINAVAGVGEAADKTVAYLAGAPGVTGQYLEAE